MSDEDLFAEVQRQEEEDAERIARTIGQRPDSKPIERRPPDPDRAHDRYLREVAPVFEVRRRLAAGLPPTTNPVKNLFLKMTGQDKIKDRDGFKVVDPTKGLVPEGPSLEEIQKQIAENPRAFRGLKRGAMPVQKVQVERKTVDDLRGGREK